MTNETAVAAPLKRTPIATHEIAAQQTTVVSVVRLDFEPGQITGRHLHPMPVIGYVIEGSFVVQVEGEEAQRFGVGQSVCEPAGRVMARFDNASATEPAAAIVHYLAGPGQDELIRFLPTRT
ncbi:MAG TPA: cupin domain-containing protein [Caulobacteraceae bacterium]|jgi:quercetin dioxygenase-like cupin family protein